MENTGFQHLIKAAVYNIPPADTLAIYPKCMTSTTKWGKSCPTQLLAAPAAIADGPPGPLRGFHDCP